MTPVEQQLAPPGGWVAAGQLRLDPLPKNMMHWWERGLVWAILKFKFSNSGIDELPVLFAVLMRHRSLYWSWLRFAGKLMPGGTLDRRDSELVILRVAWNCRCRYEWGQHVIIGLQAGLRAEDIARIAHEPDAAGWEKHQLALMRATDELYLHKQITETTWRQLSEHYGPDQLIEIGMLAGHYEMLAGLINSVELPLEAYAETALAQAEIHGN